MIVIIKRSISLLPFLALVLIVLQITVSNQVSVLSRTVRSVERGIVRESDTIELLSTAVASASSLTTISERAAGLGFRQPEKDQVLHLTPETLPVALAPVQ